MAHSLIIFASGRGSNARAIIDYFKNNGKAKVSLIISNNSGAGVLEIAKANGIPTLVVQPKAMGQEEFLNILAAHQPSLIILAGFLKKIPAQVIARFPDKIINIHPALLPRHGGKGMYGHHVHQAVLTAGEQESGITIHYVNEKYDEGNVILQAYCPVRAGDNADLLAERIHTLEHFYFPRAIEFLLKG